MMSGVAKDMSVELPSWKYNPSEIGDRGELVLTLLGEFGLMGVLSSDGIPQIEAGRWEDIIEISVEFFRVPGVEVVDI